MMRLDNPISCCQIYSLDWFNNEKKNSFFGFKHVTNGDIIDKWNMKYIFFVFAKLYAQGTKNSCRQIKYKQQQ